MAIFFPIPAKVPTGLHPPVRQLGSRISALQIHFHGGRPSRIEVLFFCGFSNLLFSATYDSCRQSKLEEHEAAEHAAAQMKEEISNVKAAAESASPIFSDIFCNVTNFSVSQKLVETTKRALENLQLEKDTVDKDFAAISDELDDCKASLSELNDVSFIQNTLSSFFPPPI